MSAIDMFGSVDILKGKEGEARVHIQLNGKVSLNACIAITIWAKLRVPNHLKLWQCL